MRRGGALVLGGVVLVAALAFASRPLGVAGLGLILAALVARGWMAFAGGPIDARVEVTPDPAIEGQHVTLRFEGRRGSRLPLGSAVVTAQLEGARTVECRLRHRGGRRVAGEIALGAMPRGRYELGDATVELRDPLGLESRSQPLGTSLTMLVLPRLVELTTLFDDAGRLPGDRRRFLLRRPSGYDFHSVREYEQGESLRRVHWPTTARRGALMVKELEDSPRESLVIVLDCDPAGDAGLAPRSSFDVAVRAAGSLLRAHVARGRRAALVTTAQPDVVTAAGSLGGDFHSVLGTLAAVRASAAHDLARFLDRPPPCVRQAAELVFVTSTCSQSAANRLLDLAAKRAVAVVWVDAPSYAGRATGPVPALLQLSSAGLPLAVVRHGIELAAALEASPREALASG